MTLVAQVKICLNSRPPSSIPKDPTDLDVLAPGHILVGSNIQAVSEPNWKETAEIRKLISRVPAATKSCNPRLQQRCHRHYKGGQRSPSKLSAGESCAAPSRKRRCRPCGVEGHRAPNKWCVPWPGLHLSNPYWENLLNAHLCFCKNNCRSNNIPFPR